MAQFYKLKYTGNQLSSILDSLGKSYTNGDGIIFTSGPTEVDITTRFYDDGHYYWYIDDIRTNIINPEGPDAEIPTATIGADDYWYLNGIKTNVAALTEITVSLDEAYNKFTNYYTRDEINQLLTNNLNNKLDKYIGEEYKEIIYSNDESGNPGFIKYSIEPDNGLNIPKRDENGNIHVSDPVNEEDATNKKYVDENITNINNILNEKANIEQIPTNVGQLNNDVGYAKITDVTTQIDETKTELENQIASKANKEHTHTTDDISNLETYISDKLSSYATIENINTIIGDAPEAYDTLQEIAEWIQNDETGTAALVNRVTEVENDLNNKANSSHTHTMADITDLSVGSKVEVNPELAGEEELITSLEIDGTKYKIGGLTESLKTYTLDINNLSQQDSSKIFEFIMMYGFVGDYFDGASLNLEYSKGLSIPLTFSQDMIEEILKCDCIRLSIKDPENTLMNFSIVLPQSMSMRVSNNDMNPIAIYSAYFDKRDFLSANPDGNGLIPDISIEDNAPVEFSIEIGYENSEYTAYFKIDKHTRERLLKIDLSDETSDTLVDAINNNTSFSLDISEYFTIGDDDKYGNTTDDIVDFINIRSVAPEDIRNMDIMFSFNRPKSNNAKIYFILKPVAAYQEIQTQSSSTISQTTGTNWIGRIDSGDLEVIVESLSSSTTKPNVVLKYTPTDITTVLDDTIRPIASKTVKDNFNTINEKLDLKANIDDVVNIVANPEGTPTEKLTSITIGNTDYSVYSKNKSNIEVDCNHEYEITGVTNHEYNLAIEDSQMIIKKIQGQTKIASENKYAFKDGYTTSGAGLTITYDSDTGEIVVNGTCNNGSSFININSQKIPDGTYSFKLIGDLSKLSAIQLFYKGAITDGFWTGGWIQSTGNFAVQFTAPENSVFTNERYKIQLVEGTYTESTMPPFKPYNNNLVNAKANLISANRNLFNKFEEGYYISAITGEHALHNNASTSDYIFIKDNISIKMPMYDISNTEKWMCRLAEFDENKNFIKIRFFIPNTEYNDTYLDERTRFVRLSFVKGWDKGIVVAVERLSKEDEIHQEVNYPVGIELGAYDYIENGQIVRQTSEVITFDGSADEIWFMGTTGTNQKRFIYNSNDNPTLMKGVTNTLICNNYPVITASDNYNTNSYGISNETTQIIIKVENVETLEDFKSWLSTNPIQIVYKKDTPTTEPILLPAGYFVWNKGLQQQVIDGDYLPYVITKEYSISDSSQILANAKMNITQQEQIDKNNLLMKTNTQEINNSKLLIDANTNSINNIETVLNITLQDIDNLFNGEV